MRGWFEISFSDSIGIPAVDEGEHRPGNAEEQENPVLFANNVRSVMAEALNIPVCDMTFEDIKKKYSKKKEQ